MRAWVGSGADRPASRKTLATPPRGLNDIGTGQQLLEPVSGRCREATERKMTQLRPSVDLVDWLLLPCHAVRACPTASSPTYVRRGCAGLTFELGL